MQGHDMKSSAPQLSRDALRGTNLEELLLSVGHFLTRDDAAMKYVLMVVFDDAGKNVVGLLKQKGPARFIGKVTFPGGQVEDELLEEAASREMLEETNLAVSRSAWRFVCRNALMAVFTASLPSLAEARTMEAEPVFTMDVDAQLSAAKGHPEMFADDFSPVLQAARAIAGFKVDSGLTRLARLFKDSFCRPKATAKEDRTAAGRRYVRESLAASTDKAATIELLEVQASNPFDPDDFDYGMLDELRGYGQAAHPDCT